MIGMNKIILILILILLQGCSAFTVYSQIYDSLSSYIVGGENQSVTREFYSEFPYSFAKARFGKSDTVIMVLVDIKDNIYHWISEDEIHLYTYNGKIIETEGLEHDIKFITNLDVSECLKSDRYSKNFYADFYNPKLYGLQIQSLIVNRKFEEHIIFGQAVQLEKCEESISARQINFRHTNVYMFDQSNNIVLTSQRIHPFLPIITLEFYIK